MTWLLFLDGIGTEIVKMTNDLIAYLQQARTQNAFNRYALILPLFAVKFFKAAFVSPFIIGLSKWYAHWVPHYRDGFKEMLIHSVPNNLRCFNKIGLCVYAVDFYASYMAVARIFSGPAVHSFYLLLKLVAVITPYMAFSPAERWCFWVIGAALMLFELPCLFAVIQGVGRGVDFRKGQFYKNLGWSKHYWYRRMSTNRKLTLEFSFYAYPAVKITFLTSFLCYNRWTAEARLLSPHKPSPAAIANESSTLIVDTAAQLGSNYLSLLTESDTVVNLRYGVLFLLALSSLSVYSIILAGWASNSKYAFIGALRSAAQMISYEVAISLIILPVVLMAGSLNLTMITYVQSITIWFVFPLLPVAILFLIAMLAETNRTPFDLPEAEAELVAGYNVDYSSLPFAMFFLGEYCNMILISTLYCLLFLGGGLNSFEINTSLVLALKAAVIWIFFVNVRATLPRYRYDQLMDIGWKVFLPISGGFLVFIFGVLVLFDALPYTTELPFNTWNVALLDDTFFETQSLKNQYNLAFPHIDQLPAFEAAHVYTTVPKYMPQ